MSNTEGNRVRSYVLRAVLLVVAAPSAFGGFMGLTGVVVDYRSPNLASTIATATVTVGAGVEINCPADPFSLCSVALTAPTQTLDIGDWTLRYDYTGGTAYYPGFSPATFGGLVFSNLDIGAPGITGLTLATNISGLDASRLSFTADSVSVNLQSLDLIPNSYFELTASSGVPEPSTLPLLAAAISGLLLRRCSRPVSNNGAHRDSV